MRVCEVLYFEWDNKRSGPKSAAHKKGKREDMVIQSQWHRKEDSAKEKGIARGGHTMRKQGSAKEDRSCSVHTIVSAGH